MISALAVVALALTAQPAAAISDGRPDADHPNVGALLFELEPGLREVACTGSLLSPRHFLTAAHCIAGADPASLSVTFDQDALTAPRTIAVSDYAIHPRAFEQRSNPYDLGVATLATAVAGIEPIELPAARLLDDAAARGGLRGHHFVNVGYGWQPNDRGRPDGLPPGIRLQSTSPFEALTQSLLVLLMRTDATGGGGVCYGDSGGPKFWEPVPGRLSNLAVAITTGGDRWCRAKNHNQRLDLPAVRTFLDDYVDVR